MDEATVPPMPDGPPMPDEVGAFLSRLHVIEDQPLESRSAAFLQIHDRLQATLEGAVREGARTGSSLAGPAAGDASPRQG